jgi:shikimate dehydrogenase
MFPNINAAPEIPYDAITPIHLLYDLIYNPAETKFLYEGKIRHATVKNGMEMLQIQAEASWKIWNQ